MRTKWLPLWLPLIALSACGLGVLLQTGTSHCALASWLCNRQGIVRDFLMMLLPLLVLALRGCFTGLRQARQTRRLVRIMLSFPRRPLSSEVRAIVHRLGIVDRIDIIEFPAPKAFCYGFLRPRICVTASLVETLTASELEAVLRHERHHLRQHDPLRSLLWTTLTGALWWLEHHAEHARLLRELAADRAVLREQGRIPLASALLKILSSPHAEQPSLGKVAISGLSETDARIQQLAHPEQLIAPALQLRQWLVLPAILLVTLALCSIFMAHLWA